MSRLFVTNLLRLTVPSIKIHLFLTLSLKNSRVLHSVEVVHSTSNFYLLELNENDLNRIYFIDLFETFRGSSFEIIYLEFLYLKNVI